MPKIYFISNECERGKIDTEHIRRFFDLNGWQIVSSRKKANIIYIGTCAFTHYKEDKAVCIIEKIHAMHTHAHIIIGGCLASINAARLERFSRITILYPQQYEQLERFIDLLVVPFQDVFAIDTRPIFQDCITPESLREKVRRCIYEYGFTAALYQVGSRIKKFLENGVQLIKSRSNPSRKNKKIMVEISKGCLGTCSYCAVRFARGSLRSRPLESILNECSDRIQQGYKKIRIVAVESGCYGLDINTDFVQLLDAIVKLGGEYELTIDGLNPQWLLHYNDKLIPILLNHIGGLIVKLSVQSGSNRILKMMNRDYTIEEIEHCLIKFLHYLPDTEVHTSMIVGFPSETHDEFLMSRAFLKKMAFNKMFIFKYSDRPGTKASMIPVKIDEKIKTKRMWMLEYEQMLTGFKLL